MKKIIVEEQLYICQIVDFHIKEGSYYGIANVITQKYHTLQDRKIYIPEKLVPLHMKQYVKPAFLILKAKLVGDRFEATEINTTYDRKLGKELYISLQASNLHPLSYLLLALNYQLLEDIVEYETQDVRNALLNIKDLFTSTAKQDIINCSTVNLKVSGRSKAGDDDSMFSTLILSLGKYDNFSRYLINILRPLFSCPADSSILYKFLHSDRGYTSYGNLINEYNNSPLYDKHLDEAKKLEEKVKKQLDKFYSSEEHLSSYIDECYLKLRKQRSKIFGQVHKALKEDFTYLEVPSIYRY